MRTQELEAKPGTLLVGVSYFQSNFADIRQDALKFDRDMVPSVSRSAQRPSQHTHDAGCGHGHGHSHHSHGHGGADMDRLHVSGSPKPRDSAEESGVSKADAVEVHSSYWVPTTCAGCGALVGQVELKRGSEAGGGEAAALEATNVKLFKHRLRTGLSAPEGDRRGAGSPRRDVLDAYTIETFFADELRAFSLAHVRYHFLVRDQAGPGGIRVRP